MSDEESFDKTEEPTEKRLEEAYKGGRAPKSVEVNNWCLLAASGISIAYLLPTSLLYLKDHLTHFFLRPHNTDITIESVKGIGLEVLLRCIIALAIPVAVIYVTILIAGIAQGYKAIGFHNIKPSFGKFNPINGLKNLVSFKSILEMIKGVIKTLLLGYALYLAFNGVLSSLPQWIYLSAEGAGHFFVTLVEKLFLTTLIVFFVITGGDYWYQRYKFNEEMKMSKQQVKDESKQAEGDPEIKGRIKGLRVKRFKAMLKKAIANANVVITNPEHFAVAVKWDEQTMRAPIVVAKGMDHMAQLIKELAKEHRIPIVENPPLARSLHKSVEIDQEIHPEQYKAVADILRSVERLRAAQF